MAESYFNDAKFFKEGAAPKEIMPAVISSTEKASVKNAKATHTSTKDGGVGNTKP